jgi:hypothetical protein
MQALAPLGLAVAPLGFTMSAKAGGFAAPASAIGLPAIAAAANTKANVTESTWHANQKHDPGPCQAPEAALFLINAAAISGLVPKAYSRKARIDASGFSLSWKINRDSTD